MIKVVIDLQDPGRAWDAFVAGHPAGHLMQSRAWAGVRRDTGWKPIFLSLVEDDALRSAALCLRLTIPWTGLGLLYCPRGPVLDYDDPRIVAAFADALRRLAREQNVFLVLADPAVSSEHANVHAALDRMGFRPQMKSGVFRILQPRWVMRIPLDAYGGPEGLLAALPHKTRYNIRLAERRGVSVAARTDADACRAFHLLLTTAGRTKGFPVRRLPYHQALWRHCVRPGGGEYLFAEHEGRVLAAIQILRFGPTAWYMYGASAVEGQNLMPTYLLQWEGIRRAWEAGCRCYDMRGVYSPTPKPEDPDFGVYDFKRKFNARLIEFLGEYELSVRPRIHATWQFLERVAQRPAAWTYRALGRLRGLS